MKCTNFSQVLNIQASGYITSGLLEDMISGFMILKDVMNQGYPFVEAIAQALPICDEFLISDGYSTDGTFELIQQIAKTNSKIKVFRYKWPTQRKLDILGEVTNALIPKCRGQYIFSVQANEVIHEESAELIRSLPNLRPNVSTFCFPYYQLLSTYKWTEEFRLRFAKNMSSIVAIGDAWTLGLSRKYIRDQKIWLLRKPRKLLEYVETGIELKYANNGCGEFSRPIYLPNPVFRYWALFPKNFLEKCQRHNELFNVPKLTEFANALKDHVDDPPLFWKLASEIFCSISVGTKYPGSLRVVNTQNHPAIMQDFILNSKLNGYYVREKVLDLIPSL
jgi:hypothetical protein